MTRRNNDRDKREVYFNGKLIFLRIIHCENIFFLVGIDEFLILLRSNSHINLKNNIQF